MKKIITRILIIISILFTIYIMSILVCVVLCITGNETAKDIFEETYVEKSLVDEKEIVSLKINGYSDTLEFYDSKDEKLYIEYCEREKDMYEYTNKNGIAEFTQRREQWSLNNILKVYFAGKPSTKIYIPNSLKDTLTIELTSGDVNVLNTNLNVEEMNIDLSSGDTNITNISVKNMKIETTSGDVNIDNSSFSEMLDIDTNAGDVIADKLKVKEINRNATSGNSEFGVIGDPSEYKVIAEVTLSGDVLITGKGVNVQEDEDIIWGNGTKIIKSEATSGDLKIVFE